MEEVSTKVKKPQRIIDAKLLFKPIVGLGKILGLFCWDFLGTNKRCSVKRVLSLFQFLVVQIILWSMAFKYGFVIYKERNSARVIPLLSIFSFHVGAGYVSTLTYFSSSKHIKNLIKHFNDYQQNYGAFQKIETAKSHIILLLAIDFFSACSGAAAFCYVAGVFLREEMAAIMYPFTFNSLENSIIAYVFIALNQIFSLSHVNLMFMMTTTVCYLLTKEFQHLTKNLKNEIQLFSESESKNKMEFEALMEKIRIQHNCLVDILEAANSLLRHYLFAFFSSAIPIICFVLFGTIRGYLSIGEAVFLILVALTFLLSIASFLILGAYLNVQAHEPLEVLMSVELQHISDKTYRIISMFTSSLNGTNIGFRVYELFTLDAKAIVTLVGTLVTYAVVMLQF